MNYKLMSHSICLTLLVLLINTGFSSAGQTVPLPYSVKKGTTAEKQAQIYTGYATWYGGGFHGRRTASGERFDMHKFTAAHRSLPFGTKVKVTNLNNKKSCIVKINDRCGRSNRMIIDLSHAAAKEIGISGSQRVKLEILE